MGFQRHKRRLLALGLILIASIVLQRLASMPATPSFSLPAPDTRVPFAIDFTFADLAGQTRRLSAVQGQPVLVNLWATWCYPCRSELPSMQALYAAYRERGLVILAIASDAGGRDTVAPFAQAYGLTFPILLDPQNSLGSRLKTPGIPTSYILDKQGRIVTLEVGARDWNKASVRHLLDTLLAEPVVTGYAAEGS